MHDVFEEKYQALLQVYPHLEQNIPTSHNQGIARLLMFYTDDQSAIVAALIHHPFGVTDAEKIRKTYPKEMLQIILALNRFHQHIPVSYHSMRAPTQSAAMIFLVTYRYVFEHQLIITKGKHMCSKTAIRYAMALLNHMDRSELRISLEDHFFKILEPTIYQNYLNLLKFTQKEFLLRQEMIVETFSALFLEAQLTAKIQGRIKTIYSIHTKITKKNLLFSQILDTIGIRVITETEDDCYQAMGLILKHNPILTSRIKDYIAIPKENGYQSIHLTILYDGYPVEIQIRTQLMHHHAQFGGAAHLIYKRNE